jgi:4-hydroxy-2-oxoheptanedioate aldolase
MIETAGAVADITSIVRTAGLDFVFIGPEDLAASMGHMGERGHPEVAAAVEHVIRTARGARMRFAMGAGHPAVSVPAEQLAELGVSFLLRGRDSNVLLAALRDLRERGGSGKHF